MHPIPPNSPATTVALLADTLHRHFPDHSARLIEELFDTVAKLFAGKLPGYRACDMAYHDFNHTCDATVALGRLLDGHLNSRLAPLLNARDYEVAVAAILWHDTGYLREFNDDGGTGARYTRHHVERGASLAARFLPPLGFTANEVILVQNIIRWTEPSCEIDALAQRAPTEIFLGQAVGSADLLGQLAAPDYPHRLPDLFQEFAESASCEATTANYSPPHHSAADLMRKTRSFWEQIARPLLQDKFGNVTCQLVNHFPDGTNHYFAAIEENLTSIDNLLSRQF